MDGGLGAAWVASLFFDEKRFHYGDVFDVGDAISDEGPMSVFLLFAPSFAQAREPFVLPDRTIHLVGLYPMHAEELEIYRELGLEKLWKHPRFDTYDPKRKPIRKPRARSTRRPSRSR